MALGVRSAGFRVGSRRFWPSPERKWPCSRPAVAVPIWGSVRSHPVSAAWRSVGAEWNGRGVGGALVEWSVAVGMLASQAARSAELCHESRAEWRCEAGCGAARVTKGGSLGRAR